MFGAFLCIFVCAFRESRAAENMLPAAENSRRATIGGRLLSALQDHDAVALKAEFLALVLYLADELGRGIVEFE